MNKGLGAPHFFTNRLYIRPIEWKDIDDFFNVCSQSEVTQYLTFNPHEYLSDTHRVIENMMRAYSMGQSVNFAIVLKSTNHLIGSASLTFNYVNRSAEVGYLLDAKYWNQGYMSEAIQALIEVAFNYYRVEFLYAKHIVENIASQKIIEKMQFKKIRVQEQSFIKNQHIYSIVEYILPKDVYFMNKK